EVRFSKAGGDMRMMKGVWRIEDLGAPGMVRLYYEAQLATGAPLPRSLIRSILRHDTPRIFKAVQAEAEDDARRGP
ncbi:MAG TPA: hypothetical protein VNH64_09555, partial [Parvularculaceae bacterium]|nr:hypothetical protein [Parvularculaceae bacterium]